MINPKVRDENSDITSKRRRQPPSTENSVGKRIIDSLNGRDFVWLSAKSGIPVNTLRDYVQKGVAKADAAVTIADALGVTVDWLLAGRVAKVAAPIAAPVISIDAAEFEGVPFFDLRDLTDTGKGEPQSWTPFRKDWLNRSLGTAFDLYLVRLLSDYQSRLGDRDLAEGDLVFCRECEPSDLVDGYIVIWRREGGLKVARYALQRRDREEGDVIYPDEVGDALFVPVARILGKYIQRV